MMRPSCLRSLLFQPISKRDLEAQSFRSNPKFPDPPIFVLQGEPLVLFCLPTGRVLAGNYWNRDWLQASSLNC